MATHKVSRISCALVLIVVGCVLSTAKADDISDEDYIIGVLKNETMTPKEKDDILQGFENQDLVLNFYSISSKTTVREFAELCQPTVLKCTIDFLQGRNDPVPARVYPRIQDYALYCRLDKQRSYCRADFDLLGIFEVIRFNDVERSLLTALVGYYKQVEAAGKEQVLDKALGDSLTREQRYSVNAYIELMRFIFGDKKVSASKELELLNRVARALTEFTHTYNLFNMLTLSNGQKVEWEDSDDILLIEWSTIGGMANDFIGGVFNYFYTKIKPRQNQQSIFDFFIPRGKGASTVSLYETKN